MKPTTRNLSNTLRVWGIGMSLFALSAPLQAGELNVPPASVEVSPRTDSWEFSLSPYGYLPWVDLTTAGGTDVNLGLDDILDSLKMTAQFQVEARKGRWGLSTDVIYVNLDFDINGSLLRNLELKEWVVMPRVNFRAWEGDWGFFDFQAGARYTNIDVQLNAQILGSTLSESGSAEIWDTSVGFRGNYNLSERWYVHHYAEIGAGDSDLIAQLYCDLTYRWRENADLFLGFRYVYYDFADDFALSDETVYGPQMGARIRF